MRVTHILLDDQNPLHRELPIYRSGNIGAVKLADKRYKVYDSMEISAHDYTALFHYGVIEQLNALPFISESNNGLDSWDEAFLPTEAIGRMNKIIERCMSDIDGGSTEKVMLGWQDDPERIAYWREINPDRTIEFLRKLKNFAEKTEDGGYDLEFIL